MQMSQMHYLPIAPVFFAILVGAFFIVLILRSVSYAYESVNAGAKIHQRCWQEGPRTGGLFLRHQG